MQIMKYLLGVVCCFAAASASSQPWRDRDNSRYVVDEFTNYGYATARCNRGDVATRCEFSRNDCDNVSQGRDYCRADSRNRRMCRIRTHCEDRRDWGVRRVNVRQYTRRGYAEATCPRGFRVERCGFSSRSCVATRQKRNSCGATSRFGQGCEITAACVSDSGGWGGGGGWGGR